MKRGGTRLQNTFHFYWGLDWLFLLGVKFEYQGVRGFIGPLYLEWYW